MLLYVLIGCYVTPLIRYLLSILILLCRLFAEAKSTTKKKVLEKE